MYIKLKAQKMLIGKNTRAFFAGVLPFLMTASLACLNYCLLIFLKNNSDFSLYVKIPIAVFASVFSLFTACASEFIRENYFYREATGTFVPVGARDVFCSFAVKILKTLLFFSWSAIFFSPSAVLLFCAYYVKTNNNYPREMTVTLLASAAITLVVGAGCFFVLFQRYSKSSFVQFTTGETNPVKVLAKSIELMEGNQIKYSLFRLSFLGWDIMCLLLFPIIYVLPYRKCAKYVFFSEKPKQKQIDVFSEKPIVFIFG